jgi:hypothetical protein
MNVEELARIAATMDAAAFQRKYPHPALVFLTPLTLPAGDVREVMGAATSASIDVTSLKETQRLDRMNLSDEPRSAKNQVVLFLRPRFDPAEGITLGRGQGNDYALPILSVSKSHATFTRSGPGWKITDLAATNGTFVDGSRLPSNGSAALAEGTAVGFGPETVARFFTAARFHAFLTGPR